MSARSGALVPVPRVARALTGAICLGAGAFVVSVLVPQLLRDGDGRTAGWDTGVHLAVGVLAALACASRVLAVRVERAAWACIAAGLAVSTSGDALWLVDPDGDAARIASIAFYPLACAGVLLLARRRMPRADAGVWLDGLVVGLAAASVAALLACAALAGADGGGLLLVGTIADLVLVAVVAAVVGMTGARPGLTWTLLGLGLALWGVSDVASLTREAPGSYLEETLIDAGWIAGLALIALAAVSRPVRRPVRVTDWSAIAVPSVASATAVLVLAFAVDLGHVAAVVLAGGAVAAALARTAVAFADLLQLGDTRRLAFTDDLTGLANRRALLTRLDEITAADERAALLVIDLDHFKELNDTLGHEAGDRLLVAVGDRLREVLRPRDLLARLNGDDFAVVLAGEHDAAGARAVAQRLRFQLDVAFAVDGIFVQLDASIGIAVRPLHAETGSELLRLADVAMELARTGHTGVATYAPRVGAPSRERIALIGQLREALDRGELLIHLQPLVDVDTQRLVSVEALVRWEHPERGLLGPAEFLPGVEQTNLMRPLTEYVVREALRLTRLWRAAGTPTPIAVNVAGPNLLDLSFADTLRRLLAETGADARDLRLEITEDGVMLDPDRTLAGMEAIRTLGVTVALDDFGTGHSSLARLRTLPVDALKIDRSFVMGMDSDRADGAIVRAAASLGRELGLTVVAEGVETDGAFAAVREAGCHLVQGYLVSRPLDVDAFERWRAGWPAARAAALG